MTCFAPIKVKINGYVDLLQTVPCGRCNGCRIKRSKDWAIRCVHEAKLHTENDYITLTYNNANLPSDHGLQHLHYQKFIRKLRNRINGSTKKYLAPEILNPEYKEIRYYMCGEYGQATEENNYVARPHYHAILFGYSYPDRTDHVVRRGNQTYLSELLSQDWGKGFIEISEVTFKSAAYVARYIIKKTKRRSRKIHNLRSGYRRNNRKKTTGIYKNVTKTRRRKKILRKIHVRQLRVRNARTGKKTGSTKILQGTNQKGTSGTGRNTTSQASRESKAKQRQYSRKTPDPTIHPTTKNPKTEKGTIMLQSIFTVYDEKAKAHLSPFFRHNSEMAIRDFTDCINRQGHNFNNHPSDYTIFLHGSFDDENAAFTLQSAPKTMGNGVEFIQVPRNEQITDDETVSNEPQIRLHAEGGHS